MTDLQRRRIVTGLTGNNGNPIDFVDPELRGFLKDMPSPAPAIDARAIIEARKAETTPTIPPGISAKTIPGLPGNPPVTVYVVEGPASPDPRPAILFIHGGGFVTGSTASSFPGFAGLQAMAEEHRCLVVSVDYRLAPETRFPGALDDNYAALKWLHDHAEALHVDRSRIAVVGESAGGGHAAMLCIAARDRGEVPIRFQLLIYPMLDDRTGSTRPATFPAGTYIFSGASNRFCWSAFLDVPAGSANVPGGAVPAREPDLRGLPPTYISVGAIDLFAQEDIAFAGRLIDAAVPTELFVAPGAYHGFFFLSPAAAISRQFAASYNAALARALAR